MTPLQELMVTTVSQHRSQTTKSPPQQRVPPHFCLQRQVASPTKMSHNSQIHHLPGQQEPSPNTFQTHTTTEPKPVTDNLTKGCQPLDSVYQPQSGYPENDQPPADHNADSDQQDSADHEEGLLDNSEVLQPQSRSPVTAPAEDTSHSAEASLHLPASHSSVSDSQPCHDHIALDSSEAVAGQQVPEAAPAQFFQLRRPQCSRITPQLVPASNHLAVGPPNYGHSCQHRDQTASADQTDVDATPGNDVIPRRHKTAGEVGPVECHIMNISS